MKCVYETHGKKEDNYNNKNNYVEFPCNEEKEGNEECHKTLNYDKCSNDKVKVDNKNRMVLNNKILKGEAIECCED